MSKWIRRPSPAMVVACIALGFALAGTGVSAVSQLVPRNSVGTVQLMDSAVARAKLRDNAVTSTKVADRSLRAIDFARGQVPAGPPGPPGETGPSGPFPDVLQAGKTIRGTFNMGGYASDLGSLGEEGVSFVFPLSSAPTATSIRQGSPFTASCPGNANFPEASPGNLCLYENEHVNSDGGYVDAVNRTGANTFAYASAPGLFYSFGAWAVTGS